MADETETTEGALRRLANRMVDGRTLLVTEIARLEEPQTFPAAWWQFLERRWQRGVQVAREVSHEKLTEILRTLDGDGA
jgi:hypothetical protein